MVGMLIDHRINLDVEPELKLPPPRPIRRRPGRGFLFGLPHVLLLLFLLFALIMLFAMFNSLGEIIVGRKQFGPFAWGLIIATLFWSYCIAHFTWRAYALPLVYRRLVVYGQATLGHITEAPKGGRVLHLHYEFTPAGGLPLKGQAVVDSGKAWKDLEEGNTVITIVYWEKNPRWSVPYICADYEVVGDA